jgi:hypothetical protein
MGPSRNKTSSLALVQNYPSLVHKLVNVGWGGPQLLFRIPERFKFRPADRLSWSRLSVVISSTSW